MSKLTVECVEGAHRIDVTLKGHLDSSNADQLRSQLWSLLAHKEAQDYHFHLKELAFLTSAGLRVLLALKQSKRAVVLHEANDVVREVFSVTGLKRVFTLVD